MIPVLFYYKKGQNNVSRMNLSRRLFMGFVSFFAACRSYVSPSFILMVPVDAMCYYLLWGDGANGTSHA